MASDRVDAAVTVEWPATAPNASGVPQANLDDSLIFRVANAATSGRATAADIPKAQRGCYWRMLTVGANVQFVFELDTEPSGASLTAPTLSYNQTVATGTGSAAAGGTLIDSIPEHVYCPANARRVTFISSATNGFFEAQKSGRKTGRGRGDGTPG